MKSLIHPKLIQLYDAFDDGLKEMCLILELIEGGELFDRVIDDDFVLTERACAIFVRQIVEGISYMHQQSILHLDMKPENILCLSHAGNRIKLIDFGLARRFDAKKKLQVLFGTPEFVAPEVVNFEQIGFATDMWSIGVIAYVLLSGLSPFMGDSDVETMANVTIARYDFDDEAFDDISKEAKEFISNLLVKEMSNRSTASQCLQHPWLRKRPPLVAPSPIHEEIELPRLISPPPIPLQDQSLLIHESEVIEIVKDKEYIPKISNKKDKPPVPPKPKTQKEELDLTKENLKQFVERWNSHPNSPYIFDSPRKSITTGSGQPLSPVVKQPSQSPVQLITASTRSSMSLVIGPASTNDQNQFSFSQTDIKSAADMETENLLRTVQETLTTIETSIKEACSATSYSNWAKDKLLQRERAGMEKFMSKQSSLDSKSDLSISSRCSPSRSRITIDCLTRDFEKLEEEFKEHSPVQSKVQIPHSVTALKVIHDATNELNSLVKQSEQILLDFGALEEHPPVISRSSPPPRRINLLLSSSITGKSDCRTGETSVSSYDPTKLNV
ncbi:hypothetical protein QYM36_010338 [Artemia franciscana]|nr:hypothetical protein QYM36_010338 [Artemia franciscana]KAK2715732.1 hypothetical protein QYM36_010338 [Artemia franciscana]